MIFNSIAKVLYYYITHGLNSPKSICPNFPNKKDSNQTHKRVLYINITTTYCTNTKRYDVVIT